MIYDSMQAKESYFTGNKTWQAVCAFIEQLDADVADGKYEVCDGVFAVVGSYPSKSAIGAEMENHQKYTDVQFLLSGEEQIGFQPLDADLEETIPFNNEKDIAFFKATAYDRITLRPGVFSLFPAKEYHMPQLQSVEGQPVDVTKVVVKIEADLLS